MKEQKPMKMMERFDENPLHSNAQHISHNKYKFVLDFRGIYMQFTSAEGVLVANHKTIVLDPEVVKGFMNILSENIKMYEKKFGKIKAIPKEEPLEEIPEIIDMSKGGDYIG